MDPKLKNLLIKVNSEYKDVRFSVYRTALKLRHIRRVLKFDKIEVSNALSVLAQPLEGLSQSPEQSFPDINASGLHSVICRILSRSQSQNGEDEIFPDAIADLTTSLVLHTYDVGNQGIIPLQSVRAFFIVMCERELVAKYKSLFWCHCEPGNKTLSRQNVAVLLNNMIQITRVIFESSHFEKLGPAVESCFSGVFGNGISEHDFVRWKLLEPQTIVWLPTMHRIISAEKSRHRVACTLCRTRPIIGLRFRCLRCVDYNACQNCFLTNANHKKSHKSSHPVQEYCLPVGRGGSLKDLARTFRNIITKRYKKKISSRSFLPIDQTANLSELSSGTWHHQSMEASSMSLPNIEYGRSQPDSRDLNVSRMSAGFADVSQLADEEKEKLDMLIERLEEERRRMMATTELLEASQSAKNHSGHPEERENLQQELEDIKHYNYELERELTDLQASIHPGMPTHSSTPHTRYAPQNGSPSQQFVPPPHQHSHNDTQYYTPDNTHPKQNFEASPSQYMTPTHSDFTKPKFHDPQLQYSHPEMDHHRKDPRVYPTNAVPHYEPLKSANSSMSNSSKNSSFPKISQMRGLSPKSSRMPMKVPREAYRSLDTSPTPRDAESPMEFSKRSFRSLGNSPRTPEKNFESSPLKSGPWGSLKVLPDAPHPKLSKQRRRSSSHTSHDSQGSLSKSGNHRNKELSQGGRSPKNFNVETSAKMYRSEKLNYSSESASLSDISDKLPEKSRRRPEKQHRAHVQSPKAARRSPHNVPDAYPKTPDSSIQFDSQTTVDSPNRASTPKPKQRHIRSNTPERHQSVERSQQKSDFTDSLSEISSKNESQRSGSRDQSQTRKKSVDRQRQKPTGGSKNHQMDLHRHSRESAEKSRKSSSSGTSHTSRARSTSVDRGRTRENSKTSIIKDEHRKISRGNTHGSLVAPRLVNSHENLEYQGSLDSLDTLHGGVSNPSLGVYGTSNSETISPIPDSPRSFDPRHEYTEEIDPYTNMHSSEHYLTESQTDLEQVNTGKPQKSKSKNGGKRQLPDNDTQSSVDSKSTHGRKKSHSKQAPSPNITSSSSFSNDGSKSSVKGRPVSKKKHKAGQISGGESDQSRTSPEGDMTLKSSEHSIEPRFETPEEEMKYLVNKLQGIMPSIHDQPIDSRISVNIKSVNPMNEVLLAAQQTRQSIRLFTEYAIAVAAGEV